MTLLAFLFAAATTGVIVLFPVAAVVEYRNSRPERGTLPIVGTEPPARRRVAGGGPLGRAIGRARAEAANLAGWGRYAADVAAELRLDEWAWRPTAMPARRMMDNSPLWRPRPVL